MSSKKVYSCNLWYYYLITTISTIILCSILTGNFMSSCEEYCKESNAQIINFYDWLQNDNECTLYANLNYTVKNKNYKCYINLCDTYSHINNDIVPLQYYINQIIKIKYEKNKNRCYDENYVSSKSDGVDAVGIIWAIPIFLCVQLCNFSTKPTEEQTLNISCPAYFNKKRMTVSNNNEVENENVNIMHKQKDYNIENIIP